MRQVKPVSDPAPSRWSYRLQRLMLTPLFRKALRFGLPFCVTLGVGFAYLSDAKRQERLVQAVADIRHQIETRPEFMVRLLAIEGASLTLEEDIREIFPYDLPLSSFDMELDDTHALVAELPPVAEATVRIGRKGVLVVSIAERQPVALWRTRDRLAAVDIEGVVIRDVAARADRPDLPVIAGEGADRAVPEAMAILQAAAPLQDQMRGLVRVGERRWDVVLDRGQRIMLPESDPVRAIERIIVLNEAQDMMQRDLLAVDMRLPERPTIRMNEAAAEEWWRVTSMTAGGEEE